MQQAQRPREGGLSNGLQWQGSRVRLAGGRGQGKHLRGAAQEERVQDIVEFEVTGRGLKGRGSHPGRIRS